MKGAADCPVIPQKSVEEMDDQHSHSGHLNARELYHSPRASQVCYVFLPSQKVKLNSELPKTSLLILQLNVISGECWLLVTAMSDEADFSTDFFQWSRIELALRASFHVL